MNPKAASFRRSIITLYNRKLHYKMQSHPSLSEKLTVETGGREATVWTRQEPPRSISESTSDESSFEAESELQVISAKLRVRSWPLPGKDFWKVFNGTKRDETRRKEWAQEATLVKYVVNAVIPDKAEPHKSNGTFWWGRLKQGGAEMRRTSAVRIGRGVSGFKAVCGACIMRGKK